MRKSLKVWATGIAVAATAAMVIPVSAAYAAPTGPVVLPTQTTGSLTINKFEQPNPVPPNQTPPDGSVQDTTGLTAIPGVSFKVQLVDTANPQTLSTSTNAGWVAIAQLANQWNDASTPAGTAPIAQKPTDVNNLTTGIKDTTAGTTYNLSNTVKPDGTLDTSATTASGVTDANGQIVLGGCTAGAGVPAPITGTCTLPNGLYLVQETGATTVKGTDGKLYANSAAATAAGVGPGVAVTVIPSVPYLVTVPVTANGNPAETNSDANNWLYAVNTYPKNTIMDQPQKSVDDSNVDQVGAPTTWTVTSEIVLPAAPQFLRAYNVWDTLDSRLQYLTSSTTPTGTVTVTLTDGTPADDTPLTSDGTATGTPLYTVTTSPSTLTPAPPTGYGLNLWLNVTNNSTSPSDTQDTTGGISKMIAYVTAHPGAKIKFTFQTTADTSGDIPNTAIVYPNGPGNTYTPGIPNTPPPGGTPSTSTDQKFGGTLINKIAGDSHLPLDGAKFEVYAITGAAAPADATAALTACEAYVSNSANSPVTVNPATNPPLSNYSNGAVVTGSNTTWTTGNNTTLQSGLPTLPNDNTKSWVVNNLTDSPLKPLTLGDGQAVIDGLRASDYADGQTVSAANGNATSFIQYCLVETQAPAGYSLLANPIPFTVNSADIPASSQNMITFAPGKTQFLPDGTTNADTLFNPPNTTTGVPVPAGITVNADHSVTNTTTSDISVYTNPTYAQYTLTKFDSPLATTDPNYNANGQIMDTPVNGGFQLPFTGSTGTAVIFTTGGILVAAAIVLVVIVRKRSADRDSATTSL
jgi:hypothetical protein